MFGIFHHIRQNCIHSIIRCTSNLSVLVIAENEINQVSSTTHTALSAARKISDNITVLIPGSTNSSIAKYISTRQGVSKVYTADNVNNDGFPEENFTSTILATHRKHNFSHIVGVSSKLGKSVLPRVAAKLDVPALTNIVGIKAPDTFVQPIYAGNALMTVKVMDPVKVVIMKEVLCSSKYRDARVLEILQKFQQTIKIGEMRATKAVKTRKKDLQKLQRASGRISKWELSGTEAPIEFAPTEEVPQLSKNPKQRVKKSKQPHLVNAKTVICGGGGLQSKKNFKSLYELANSLDAAVGATKSAVDKGFAPKHLQVGQIGTTISPDLYIGIGVSGNLEHITGIKDSRIIVAINNDPNAPLFRIADYGVVMNLFDALPTMKYLIRHF